MSDITIVPLMPQDVHAACELWNRLCECGDMIYSPMNAQTFCEKLCIPEARMLWAQRSGQLIGFIHGTVARTFLHGEDATTSPAYLTAVCVAPEYRNQGVGHRLMEALRNQFRQEGKHTMACSGDNPVHLAWRIPDTPNHDHNNAPGVDEDGVGFGFLKREGMRATFHEIAMYRALEGYVLSEEMLKKQCLLSQEGIVTGRYDPAMGCDYDQMCDRVGSEYWRSSIRAELAAWKTGVPNQVPEFWADGLRPARPRIMLTATYDGHIIGFTGPIDKQKSGRGWFTGICTDPAWGGRGIASVLFALLLSEFVAEGATFCTLFTGQQNHAQKIYAHAGMHVVRRFSVMVEALTAQGGADLVHF